MPIKKMEAFAIHYTEEIVVKKSNTFMRTLMPASIIGLIIAGNPLGAQPAEEDAGKTSAQDRGRIFASWSPDRIGELRKKYGLLGPGPQSKYPEARFPKYLKTAKTVDELMPAARAAVRQTAGRVPLGLANPGDEIMIVVPWNAERLVQDAIKRAYAERKIKAHIQYENELAGVSKADMAAIAKAEAVMKIGDGQQELNFFYELTGQVADAEKGRDWLKEKDPDLYKATWPIPVYTPRLKKISDEYQGVVKKNIQKYLKDNPAISKVFMGLGARNKTRRILGEYADKFYGSYTYNNHFDISSKVPDFPADVWRMVETKTIESLAFTDRLEVSDPEGTALAADLTPETAEAWAKGVYQQGHLYMFPTQATGRWPYSLINYPAYEKDKGFLMPVLVEATGVIASTNSHRATHPRMEMYLDKGKVVKVAGGGWYGEGFRDLLSYPGTNDLTWPFFNKPGYWWLYEAGTATNPKYFKHPGDMLSTVPPRSLLEGGNLSERNVAGVIHWAVGAEAEHGPEVPGMPSPKSIEFGKKYNVPIGHAMHQHTVLPTYQVRIRGSGQWLTLIEHGNLASLNDPEVRALAARYGNPDELLHKDFVHPIPGITIAGKYDDYGKNPGAWWQKWAKQIEDGTSPYMK
jgi:hypothetical protein